MKASYGMLTLTYSLQRGDGLSRDDLAADPGPKPIEGAAWIGIKQPSAN